MEKSEMRQPRMQWKHRRALSLRLSGAATGLSLCCILSLHTPTLSAQEAGQAGAKGAVLFNQNCSGCHGSDGRGGEHAPNIATQHNVVAMSDAELRSIVVNGIPSAGMPSFASLGENQADVLLGYLRTLQGRTSTQQATLPGDPQAGEAIFFSEGSCSRCHSVEGRGGFMADDLSDYARGRSAASVESAIVHPADNPGDRDHQTTVETVNGETIMGLVRAQDNFTVVMQSEDGAFHNLPRDTIRRLTVSKQPYMPQDYGTTLSKKQRNDLISYLMKSAASAGVPQVIPAEP